MSAGFFVATQHRLAKADQLGPAVTLIFTRAVLQSSYIAIKEHKIADCGLLRLAAMELASLTARPGHVQVDGLSVVDEHSFQSEVFAQQLHACQ